MNVKRGAEHLIIAKERLVLASTSNYPHTISNFIRGIFRFRAHAIYAPQLDTSQLDAARLYLILKSVEENISTKNGKNTWSKSRALRSLEENM